MTWLAEVAALPKEQSDEEAMLMPRQRGELRLLDPNDTRFRPFA